MKTIYIAVFFALVFAFALCAQAQVYSVPKKLPIQALVRREFREWMPMPSGYPGLIPETFFPIGWSKDGKFAYYTEPVDEACGCYYAYLAIQDMRTDKVVWEFKYSQDDLRNNETGKMPPENNIAKLWRKNVKLFSDKLRENGIVASRFALLGRTFASGGRTFTVAAKVGKANDPDGMPRAKTITITLSSPKLGSKVLYKAASGPGEALYTAPLDAGVIGVLKSPYEDRIAIVAIEVNRGYEGPPHTGDIRVAGADLVRGFDK